LVYQLQGAKLLPLDSIALPLITLLHALVFVYWLGGDLGAFYASSIVLDPRETPASRVTAARIIGAVDMAPRTALILTFPTGIWLAQARGWVEPSLGLLVGVWIVCVIWLALVWASHVFHMPAGCVARRSDLAIRWSAMLLLFALAIGWIAPFGELPTFIQVKCGLLAAAIGCGLVIRGLLGPFGPALLALADGGATSSIVADIARSLGRARVVVPVIWLLLICSAAIGLWRPG
jgi:hypothetical protein